MAKPRVPARLRLTPDQYARVQFAVSEVVARSIESEVIPNQVIREKARRVNRIARKLGGKRARALVHSCGMWYEKCPRCDKYQMCPSCDDRMCSDCRSA